MKNYEINELRLTCVRFVATTSDAFCALLVYIWMYAVSFVHSHVWSVTSNLSSLEKSLLNCFAAQNIQMLHHMILFALLRFKAMK